MENHKGNASEYSSEHINQIDNSPEFLEHLRNPYYFLFISSIKCIGLVVNYKEKTNANNQESLWKITREMR